MKYILKHKNINVLSFEMNDDGYISKIDEIFNKAHIPLNLDNKSQDMQISLNEFWKSRSIPASRQNIQETLEILGEPSTDSLVRKSFGLSLSDQYWALPEDKNILWGNINFFQNSFSNDVGEALFGNFKVIDSNSLNLVSPDSTSDGWLKKRWIIQNGKRILLKAGSLWQQEPYNEVLATEICDRLKFNHVAYKIIKTDNHIYSECPDFITADSELIPAGSILNVLKKDGNTSLYNHFINCAKAIGLEDIQKLQADLCNMLLVDFIVANTDRHFNNFGFIRNPDTLKITGLAPIFDTGTSMFCDKTLYDLKNSSLQESYNIKSKPFGTNQLEQIKRIPLKNYCSRLDLSPLENLPSYFYDLTKDNPRVEEERRNILCNILSNRILEAKKMIAN